MDTMYEYSIPKYTMTLGSYTQAKNMVVEHATRWLLNMSDKDLKQKKRYTVSIFKYSDTADKYEPYLNVVGYRNTNGVVIKCKKFTVRMSMEKARKFLLAH